MLNVMLFEMERKIKTENKEEKLAFSYRMQLPLRAWTRIVWLLGT